MMKIETETIFYKGNKITVEYEYSPAEGDNWHEQYFPDYISIISTKLNDKKINYSEEQLNEIESILWNNKQNNVDIAGDDYLLQDSWEW